MVCIMATICLCLSPLLPRLREAQERLQALVAEMEHLLGDDDTSEA